MYYNRFPSLLIGGGLHPYTKEYLDAWAAYPSLAEVKKIDRFIKDAVTKGFWNHMDSMWFLKASENQGSRVNMVNPSNVASVVGSPTFSAGNGWTGSTTSHYLNTGLAFSAMTHYSLNNAHLGVYVNNNVNANVDDLGGAANSYIRSNEPSYDLIGQLNNGAANSSTWTTANFAANGKTKTSQGHSVIQRTSSTDMQLFKDGDLLTLSSGGSRASTVIPTGNLFLCRGQLNGTRQLGFAHCGSAMPDALVKKMSDAIALLMA